MEKNNEEILKALFDNSQIGIALYGLDYKLKMGNPFFCETLGYSEDELKKMTFAEITSPEDLKDSLANVKKLQEGKVGSFSMEKRYVRKDKGIIDALVHLSTIKNENDLSYFIVSFENITEKNKILKQLSESEEKFKNAFSNSVLGMALVSPTGKWLQVNQAVTKILGYSEKEILSMDFKDVTYPEEVERDLAAMKKLIAGDLKSYQVEKRYISKSGDTIWVFIHVNLVRDKDNKPLYFITEIEDINQRKKDEVALQEKVEELQKVNKMMVDRELKMVELKKKIDELGGGKSN